MADDTFDEDIFDDLYDDEPASNPAPTVSAARIEPEPALGAEPASAPSADPMHHDADAPADNTMKHETGDAINMDASVWAANGNQSYDNVPMEDDNYGPINVKEDG